MGRIVAVPSDVNILKRVAEELYGSGDVSSALFIFPSRRAMAFFRYYLGLLGSSTMLLPRMYTLEDWAVERFYLDVNGKCAVADGFTQAWLIYLAAKDEGVADDWGFFMRWAFRLADVFREFELEQVEVRDRLYPEPTLGERVGALLERLGRIYDRYRKLLEDAGFTTMPLILAELSKRDFAVAENTHVVGFYALTRSEEGIFRRMFDEGAVFWWHLWSQDGLAPLHERWLKDWGLSKGDVEFFNGSGRRPEISFFEGHSLHSQLEVLAQRLNGIRVDRPDRVAVVLMNQEALIPVVMHLPGDLDVNVTLGYPLKLTGFYSYFGLIHRIIQGKFENRYRVADLVDLARLPFFNAFGEADRLLSLGYSYVDFNDLVDFPEVKEILSRIVRPFEGARTPKDFYTALRSAVGYTISKSGNMGDFEKAFLAKMVDEVFEVFGNPLFASEPVDLSTMFEMLFESMRKVRVPFEGEPLKGLQVMGILETRLLSFDEVFVLDANDDVLPGSEEINPVLPPWIRKSLGLPDRYRREEIAKYHFLRLINSSRRAHILWRHQITAERDGFEGKKTKSRFVEELIWQRELEAKRPLENEIVKRIQVRIPKEMLSLKSPLEKRKEHKEILDGMRLSPTHLDTYIQCPLKFYYLYILQLEGEREPEEVSHARLGEVLHSVLYDYYSELAKGNFPFRLKREFLKPQEIFERFMGRLEEEPFFRSLSPAKRFMLEETVKHRIRLYVEGQPEELEVEALEKPLYWGRLWGRADRIDRRRDEEHGEYIVIVDYKTGWAKLPTWGDGFRERSSLLAKRDPQEDYEGWLEDLSRIFKSVQLPVYTLMYLKNREGLKLPVVGAIVRLNRKGEEEFFPEPVEEANNWTLEVFSCILEGLIKHIHEAPFWYPSPGGRGCSYCQYRWMCRYSV